MYQTDQDLTKSERFLAGLRAIHGEDPELLRAQAARYQGLAARAAARGNEQAHCFCVPGRTELAGNHTDHSQGLMLAAAIDVDLAAVVAPRPGKPGTAHFELPGEVVDIRLDDLAPNRKERGTTAALVRGVAARFKALGHRIGGFEAFAVCSEPVSSELISGAVEVLVAKIFSELYNEAALGEVELALIGQFAKNRHYGKPCGIMDQITPACGGVLSVDCADPAVPAIQHLELDLAASGYALLAIDTGGDPREFAEDYAAVAWEMKLVAAALGRESCRLLDKDLLQAKAPELRPLVGDRPLLRAMHYLEENERVLAQVAALGEGRFQDFLDLVRESSLSSFMWLQNIISPSHVGSQGVTVALAITERYIKDHGSRGACRIHGAGFAGTIQAWIPRELVNSYKATIEPFFVPGCVQVLNIRTTGAARF